jgi:glycosyltransferase involved in cell wall biosynthesis
MALDAQATRQPKDRPVVLYCGGITRDRGIHQLIEAVEKLHGEAELWLLGRWEDAEFRSKCERIPGFNSVRDFGAVHPDDVFGYIKQADVGACTLLPRPNYLKALPTKVYEYMACSVPALISDFPHWRKHFTEGVVFVNPQDPQEIAQAIRSLLADSEARSRYGQRGRSLLEDGLSWEEEEKRLLRVYEGLI